MDEEIFVGSCSQPELTDHDVWGKICLLAIPAKDLGRDGHRNPWLSGSSCQLLSFTWDQVSAFHRCRNL